MSVYELIPGSRFYCLCLHGFAPQDAEQWQGSYQLLLRCFERLGVQPERVTLEDVPGLSNESRSVKSWESWLKKNSFSVPSSLSVNAGFWLGLGNFRYRVLHTRAQGYISGAVFDERGLMAISGGTPLTRDGGLFTFYCDAALHREAFKVFGQIVLDAASCPGFEYGYAFTLSSRELTPTLFCQGSKIGDLPVRRNLLREKWGKFCQHTPMGCRYAEWIDGQLHLSKPSQNYIPGPSYCDRLRDVFSLNYLLDSHLALPVGSTCLGEWIREDSGRGLLRQLKDGFWVWSVPGGAIGVVREALKPSGVLVVYGNENGEE